VTTEVFYRKWRPRTFSQVVGQEPITTTLRQSVAQGRVAHAYLFCGPRGTGKTSTARILAKAVNCLEPQEGEPCDGCAVCQAINQGRFLDMIEVDAASNRRIDDFRNIRDKVNFAPSEGRYKVYIIDESHQLTGEASNAFLKTLEEPPGHVIFVLCTTEPHKVLPTIISRCQRFDFRRLSSEVVAGRLNRICRDEGIEAEPEALRALARAVSGSLRDGENLLEQLVVSYGSPITMTRVQELLGLGGTEDALSLVRYLLKGNVAEALTLINHAAWSGTDLRQLHRLTVEFLRGVLVYQCGAGETLDQPAEVAQMLEGLAKTAPMDLVVRALRKMGEANTRHDDTFTLPLELAVVEVCGEEEMRSSPTEEQAPRPRRSPGQAAAGGEKAREAPRSAEAASPPPKPEKAPPPAAAVPGQEPPLPVGQWNQVVKALSRYKGKRFMIGPLLRDCKSHYLDGDSLVLSFSHQSHFERFKEEMENPQCRRDVEDAFAKALDGKYELRAVLAEGNSGNNSPTSHSPMVRTALGLGARILEEKEDDE